MESAADITQVGTQTEKDPNDIMVIANSPLSH